MKEKLFRITSEEKIRNYSPLKAVLYFSIPTILMALVTSSYALVDKYISLQFGSKKIVNEYQFINSISEAKAVINAATNYANPLVGFLSAFVVFASAGISIPFAIAFGKNSKTQMRKILANGFVISLIICFVVSLCFYFITDPFVRFQTKIQHSLFDNQDQHKTFALMIDLAIKYDQIYTIGFTLLLFSNVLSSCLRNEGKTFIVSFINISAVFINILVSWLLVGVANLGMIGSVYGSIITWSIINMVLLIFIFLSTSNHLKFSLADLKLDSQVVKQICATGIVQFTLGSAWAIIGFINNRLDTSVSQIEMINNTDTSKVPIVVQAWSAMGPWIGFLEAPNSGILQAATMLMGYAYGSKMYQRFWKIAKHTFWIITLFYCFTFLIVLAIGQYMLSIFGASNPGKYRWGFLLIVAGYLFVSLSSTSLAAFQTMQKSLIAFITALIRPLLCLPFSVLGWFVAWQTYEPLWYFAFSGVIGLGTLIVQIPFVIRVWKQNKHLIAWN